MTVVRTRPVEATALAPATGVRRRVVHLAGLAALVSVGVTLASDVAGSLLFTGYSPVADLISELHQRGATTAPLVATLQTVGKLLLLPVALGLHLALPGRRRAVVAPALLVAATVVFVAATTYLRCDPGCLDPETAPGAAHLALSVVAWSLYLAAVVGFGRRMAGDPAWSTVARHSRLTVWIGLATAAATGLAVRSDVLGLAERAFSYTMYQWLLVVGIAVVRPTRRRRRPAPAADRGRTALHPR